MLSSLDFQNTYEKAENEKLYCWHFYWLWDSGCPQAYFGWSFEPQELGITWLKFFMMQSCTACCEEECTWSTGGDYFLSILKCFFNMKMACALKQRKTNKQTNFKSSHVESSCLGKRWCSIVFRCIYNSYILGMASVTCLFLNTERSLQVFCLCKTPFISSMFLHCSLIEHTIGFTVIVIDVPTDKSCWNSQMVVIRFLA